MNKNCKITPEGTRDFLFKECLYRRHYESTLLSLFRQHGFNEVATPGIEFYDMFTQSFMSMPQELMYKTIDSKGRLLVMRPDCTLPIARMAATRLQNAFLPIRLCYSQTVYRHNPTLAGKSDEVLQAGVELMGSDGLRSDLEILKLAADTLDQCSKDDYVLEIGHADIFKELCARLPVSDEQRETIRNFIEGKSYSALNDYLDSLGQSPEFAALKQLPRMFGSREILDMAESIGLGNSPAIAYLSSIYDELCKMGLENRVMFDLGLVHQNEYYTGLIFRGYVQGFGATILSGGRYDSMMPQFGRDYPAVGFAVDVDAVAEINLAQRHELLNMKRPDVLIHALDGYQANALLLADKMTASDECITVEMSVFNSVEAAKQYAMIRNIPKIIVVGQQNEEIIVD